MPRNYKKVAREHKTHTRVSEDDRALALALIDAGLNTSQIEDQTGVSRSQIRRYKRNLRMWNSPEAPRLKAPGRPAKSRPNADVDGALSPVSAAATHSHPADDPMIEATQSMRARERDPMEPSRMLELSAIVASAASTIDQYLRASNLPFPSFDQHAPRDPVPTEAVEIQRARTALIDAAAELQDLLVGPARLCQPTWTGTSIHAIQRFRIAQKVPVGGCISFVQLARACDIREPTLRRILRHAMVHHRVFTEPTVGQVAHTAASKLLAENELLQDQVAATCNDLQPGLARTVGAVGEYQDDEPRHGGYALAFKDELDQNTLVPKDLARSKALSTIAMSLRAGHAFATDPTAQWNVPQELILSTFPWAILRHGATVVDMNLLPDFATLGIADTFPHISLVVQGHEDVLRRLQVSSHLESRVTIVSHDLFEEQRVVGADVYLMRSLLRNWPDKYCVRILQKLIPALKSGARILLSDVVMPEPQTMSLDMERRARQADLTMMTLRNSKERDRDEWTKLLHRADRRFRVASMQPPVAGSGISNIEVVWSRS